MNYDRLKEMGLSNVQVNQVISEHNRANRGDSPVNSDKQLEDKRQREEIMAIKDTDTRQRLIRENPELFGRGRG